MMECTLDDIIYKTGLNKSSVSRRLKNVRPLYRRSNGGRPVDYYDSSVLNMFYTLDMPEPEVQVIKKEESVLTMTPKVNPCKNKSRVLTQSIADDLVKITYRMYTEQSDKHGLKRACDNAIYAYWDMIEADLVANNKVIDSKGKVRDMEYMQDYWYFKVINRSDKINKGVAKHEQWVKQWESKHNFNKANALKATAKYSMLEMLENAGLIAPGRGAGLIWVIDGTQFDAFVRHDNGDTKKFSYLMIMDGVTKMPLYAKALEDGEKIVDVAEALWECVQLHGVPPLGIIADNGSAFKSREIQALVRSWYSPEQLEYFKSGGCLIRRELYRTKGANGKSEPQRGAILYPLAKVPRAAFKAIIERSFHEINRHQSQILAASYIGTRDSKAVTHELGTTPTEALRLAPPKDEAWKSFLWFLYFNYATRIQGDSDWLGYAKTKHGIKPSPAEVWKFYGGKFGIGEDKIESCIRKNDGTEEKIQIGKVDVQSEAKIALYEKTAIAYYEYVKAGKQRHLVTCKDNYVEVTHEKIDHMYVGDCLNLKTSGEKLIVVVDSWNSRRAYIFRDIEPTKKQKEMLEKEKKSSPLPPSKGEIGEEAEEELIIDKAQFIQYVGEVFSTRINDFAQVKEVRQLNSKSRKQFKKDVEAYDVKMLGEKFELKNHKVEAGQYAEYQLIESTPKSPKGTLRENSAANVQPNSPLAGQLLSSANLPKIDSCIRRNDKETFGRYEESDIANLLDITDLMGGM